MEQKRSNFYPNGEVIDYSLPQSFKKSLTKDKDSLGFLIEQVFDKNKKGSASDIIVELEKETTINKTQLEKLNTLIETFKSHNQWKTKT